MRATRIPFVAAAVLLVLGCDPTTAPRIDPGFPEDKPKVQPDTPPDLLDHGVSDPATSESAPAGGAAAEVAYVGFATGELGSALSVMVSNATAGIAGTTSYPVHDGALDPVAIAAEVGDTLALQVLENGGRVGLHRAVVPAKRPPRIIRTNPSKGRTDVAVNATVTIIFSEPVDTATITTGTVRLLRGDVPVTGRFAFPAGPALAVEFIPDAALQPGAEYRLLVGEVRDLSGDPLEETAAVEFVTADVGSAWVHITTSTVGNDIPELYFKLYLVHTDGDVHQMLVQPNGSEPFFVHPGSAIQLFLADLPPQCQVSTPTLLSVGPLAPDSTVAVEFGLVCESGTLHVRTRTVGENAPDAYAVAYDFFPSSWTFPIAANALEVRSVPAGSGHWVQLRDIPAHCRPVTPNPQFTGPVAAGATVSVEFEVECGSPPATQPVTSQAIAFVRGGDIFAVDVEGSNEVRLTGTGMHSSPAWSRDGTRLAFGSCCPAGIDLLNVDGSGIVRRAVEGNEPAWSPDGAMLAYSGAGGEGQALFRASVTGGAPLRLTEGNAWNEHPDWSPTGGRIAFVSDRDLFEYWGSVFVMNADGSAETRITDTASAHMSPKWSPDGTRIAYVRGDLIERIPGNVDRNLWYWRFTVSIMAADGTGARDLAWAGDLPYQEGRVGSIAWSPDGSMVAFTAVDCDMDGSCPWPRQTSIRYVTLDGSRQGTIVTDAHSPTWRR